MSNKSCPSVTIRYAITRLAQEDERERRGLPSTVQYWAAYMDGARAQYLEDIRSAKQLVDEAIKEVANEQQS